MRGVEIPEIRNIPLFEGMEDESFDLMLKSSYFQRFPPQVQLITEGDPPDFLHIVVDGAVELFAHSNNRETTLAILRPVATFILAAVLKDAVYLMSARTLEPSHVLMIPSENIRAAMVRDHRFSRQIVIELANCYRGVVRAQKSLKLRTGVERLANFLIRIDARGAGDGKVRLLEDKKKLAGLLGMTPENLSRAFGTLKKYGVEVDGNDITLTNLEDLKGLAKPNPLIDDRSI